MPEERYSAYGDKEMILRDYLAVDRTIMANESSFLSYIRTSLTLLVTAITMLKFLDSTVFHVLGWVLIGCALLLTVHGATRYETMGRILERLTGELKQNPNQEHANYAKRFLMASKTLIELFR